MRREQSLLDSIPLLPIGAFDSENDSQIDDCVSNISAQKVRRHSVEDDDGAAPLAIFFTNKEPLRPAPVRDPFTPLPKTLLARLSSSFSPFLVLVILALVSHEIDVSYYNRKISVMSLHSPVTIWPAARGTLVLLAMVQLALYHQQEVNQQLWIKAPAYRWIVLVLQLVVIFLLAPMLMLPIHDSCHIVHDGSQRKSLGPLYATMNTWSQAVPNMNGALPALTSQWEDLTNISPLMPDPITFPLPNNGKGPDERRWNEQRRQENYNRDTNGLYLPFARMGDFPEAEASDMILENTITTTTEVIANQLHCEFAKVESFSVTEQSSPADGTKHEETVDSTKDKLLLSVKVRDKDDCVTTVSLQGRHLDNATRNSLRAAVSKIRLPLDIEGRLAVTLLKEIYEAILEDGVPVVTFTPAWAPYISPGLPSPVNKTECSQRLAVVGLRRPLMLLEMNFTKFFQVASCEPEFTVADIELGVRRTRERPLFRNPFATPSGLSTRGEPPLKDDNMFIERIITHGPLKSGWVPLGLREDDALLRTAFIDGAATVSIRSDSQATREAMDGDFADIIRQRPQHVGALLLAGRALRRAFTTRLTTASEVTLEELLQRRNGGFMDTELTIRSSTQTDHVRVQCSIFQNTTKFHVCLWLIGVIIAVLCVSHDLLQERTDGRLWPLLSPASRALLLCQSSVGPALRKFYQGGTLELPQNMRVGYWTEKGQPKTYKLDLHDQDSTGDKHRYSTFESWKEACNSLKETLEWDKYGYMHFVYPAVWAALLIVSYCVLQPLALTRKGLWRRQSEDKTAETWRLLGVESLGLNSPPSLISNIGLRIIPSGLILFCAMYWIPRLSQFLVLREPYSAMRRGRRPAEQSITVDYHTTWFPFLYALKKRHRFISVLAIARIAAIWLPFVQSRLQGLFRYEAHPRFGEARRFEGHTLQWGNDQGLSQIESVVFDRGLKELVDTLAFRDRWPCWSSSEVTLLPLDLSEGDIKDPGPRGNEEEATYNSDSTRYRHFQYNTTALRTTLLCEGVPIETVINRSSSSSSSSIPSPRGNVSSYGIEQLIIAPGLTQEFKIFSPCKTTQSERLGLEPEETASPSETMCIRWLLNDKGRWIIAILRGPAFWASDETELRFSNLSSTMALSCQSSLKKEPGNVLLSSNRAMFGDSPCPVQYQRSPDGVESVFNRQLVAALDRGLNTSNSRLAALKDRESGITAAESLVHTDRFAGDLMSWLLYRRILATPMDLESVQDAASTLFAGYIAHLAHPAGSEGDNKISPPMQVARDPMIELQPVMLHTVRRPVEWLTASFVIAFVVLFVGVLICLPRAWRRYTITPSPEPLINGLLILAGGNLVSRLCLEDALDMTSSAAARGSSSLSGAYRSIEGLGLRYMLEPLGWTGLQRSRLTVNTCTVDVGDEHAQGEDSTESRADEQRRGGTVIDSGPDDRGLSTTENDGYEV